ncbi:hypothetical protein E2C01_092456 [Portunus trituberculatus]|uniref:Uncharacterized protein n=1 Tax=Portunus trituberculatus TaxID=210409 RepID=A0A5B7JGI1_PORTR|nr:hypothetical protein [Portunus trituberculatus]
MHRIRTRALGDPSDPKARMVPLYHGVCLSFVFLCASPPTQSLASFGRTEKGRNGEGKRSERNDKQDGLVKAEGRKEGRKMLREKESETVAMKKWEGRKEGDVKRKKEKEAEVMKSRKEERKEGNVKLKEEKGNLSNEK